MMSAKLLSVILQRSLSRASLPITQAIPLVFAFAFRPQTRHVAHGDHSHQTVFPAVKRIPVRFEDEIESVITSNWDKIEKYASILKCKTDMVERLVRSDTRLVTSFNTETICKKLQLLVEYKYDPEEICTNPPVFCLNFTEMEKRLADMEAVRSYHSQLYLACLAKRTFKKKIAEYKNEMTILGDHPSKLHFFADKLDCDVNDIYDLIDQGYTHLLTRPPSSIDGLVNIIKQHGFTTDDIRKFPIGLSLSVPEARRRFEIAKKCGVLEKISLGTMLVTNTTQFNVSVRSWMTELSYLDGSTDCNEILKKRLEVSDKQLAKLHKRNVMLRKLRAKKIQTCLDILLDDMNIDIADVVRKPEVLYYSPERLQKRHLILQSADVNESRQKVYDLCLSETKFTKKYMHLIIKHEHNLP